MTLKRREFFKFLAAAPAAALAPIVGRPGTEVSAKDIVIEGKSVTLYNWNVENAAFHVRGGAEEVRLGGIHIKEVEPVS